MKAKLEVGAELDFLTKGELKDELKAWSAEMFRGGKFRRVAMTGAIASNAVTIGGEQVDRGESYGPEDGFVWSVRRMAVSGFTVAAADLLYVYLNDASPTQLVGRLGVGGLLFDRGQVVMSSGDQLVITGASLSVATGQAVVSVGLLEVPQFMTWLL